MKGDAELIRKLICCAWDAAPDTLELSLADCLALYARTLAAENAQTDAQGQTMTEPPESPARAAAIFKRKTHERLVAYRQANGVGSFAPLAEACRGDLTTEDLSKMLVGERFPIEAWREVAAALDILEPRQE